jgi:hypothetical protein
MEWVSSLFNVMEIEMFGKKEAKPEAKENAKKFGRGRNELIGVLQINRQFGSTTELGLQKIVLSPGASSTCDGNACCCTSCW